MWSSDQRRGASMRRAVVLFAFLVGATQAFADSAEWAATRVQWNTPGEPFRAIGNIYYVGTRELAAWMIATPRGGILLDAALPESAPLIEQNLKTLGFSVKGIKILLNTHAHFDHSGGLAQIKRDSGAGLGASAGDRESLESGRYLGSEDVQAMASVPVHVDRLIADGEEISLGNVTLTAHLMPGHTRGCTSWTMTVIEAGIPHSVIFYCSTSVAANRLAPREQYPGIVADYRSTFDKLRTMKADVFLGIHQGFFRLWEKRAAQKTGAPNPFIDPFELESFVASSRQEFEVALTQQMQQGTR